MPDKAPQSLRFDGLCDAPDNASLILARGAGRGEVLEHFGPVWQSARLRLARASWDHAGLDVFAQLDVPYTGTSSGRLSEDAVHVVLAARQGEAPLRVLELGAGSGIFARMFLEALRRIAPEIHATARYVVSDGSAALLDAQRREGLLSAHAAQVDYRVLDITGDWGDVGEFDAIFGTYILDSLPFDLLAIRDAQVWRREGRSVLDAVAEAPEREAAEALRLALETGADLRPFRGLAPFIGLQTRHVAVARADLPHAATLPDQTGGETLPFVHSHGALDCLDRCLSHLRPGGVMVFSDYGHLEPHGAHDLVGFQSYGETVAVGLNFPQIGAAMEARAEARLWKAESDGGNLHTRVIQRRPGPDLAEVVEDRYGPLRLNALTAPCEVARDFLRGRMFEVARGIYAKALRLEPRNWALMQEIAGMLANSGDARAAAEMAAEGLALNPLSAEMWRVKGVAHLDLGEPQEARAALSRATALAPGSAIAWLALARLEIAQGLARPALLALAEALAADREGDLRDEIMEAQQKALAGQAKDQWRRLIVSANIFRPLDDSPE